MAMEKSHRNCKYFGYRECPHFNDEIMKSATQDTPETLTGAPILMKFPDDE